MEKFINKDTLPTIVVSVIVVLAFLFQSQYFATKLDVADLRNEVLTQKIELQQYSDNGDKEILKELDLKYEKIILKLDRIKQ